MTDPHTIYRRLCCFGDGCYVARYVLAERLACCEERFSSAAPYISHGLDDDRLGDTGGKQSFRDVDALRFHRTVGDERSWLFNRLNAHSVCCASNAAVRSDGLPNTPPNGYDGNGTRSPRSGDGDGTATYVLAAQWQVARLMSDDGGGRRCARA